MPAAGTEIFWFCTTFEHVFHSENALAYAKNPVFFLRLLRATFSPKKVGKVGKYFFPKSSQLFSKLIFRYEKLIFFFQIFFSDKVWSSTSISTHLEVLKPKQTDRKQKKSLSEGWLIRDSHDGPNRFHQSLRNTSEKHNLLGGGNPWFPPPVTRRSWGPLKGCVIIEGAKIWKSWFWSKYSKNLSKIMILIQIY